MERISFHFNTKVAFISDLEFLLNIPDNNLPIFTTGSNIMRAGAITDKL